MSQGALQSSFLYVWVTSDLLDGASFSLSGVQRSVGRYVSVSKNRLNRTVEDFRLGIQNQTMEGQIWRAELWENMSISDCMQTKQGTSSAYGIVFLVTERLPVPSTSSVTANESTGNLTQRVLGFDLDDGGGPSLSDWQYLPLEEWRRVIPGWRTVYCLAKRVPQRCRLQIHVWFLLVVVILNTIKLCCLVRTFWEQKEAPLITMGDAIASFLQRPCQLTRGLCLLPERALIRHLRKRRDPFEETALTRPEKFKVQGFRLASSISYLSWLTYIIW